MHTLQDITAARTPLAPPEAEEEEEEVQEEGRAQEGILGSCMQ